MAYTQALLCVLMIYLHNSAIGIHGNRIKRVEDRMARMEIRQNRESASRQEELLNIYQKLDDITTLVNETLTGKVSVEPDSRLVAGAKMHYDTIETLEDDVLVIKKAFAEEKARWRREAAQMENTIKGFETGLNNAINGIQTDVHKNIDAFETAIKNDIKNMEDSLTEKVKDDYKNVKNSVQQVSEDVKSTMDISFNEIREEILALRDLVKDAVANCSHDTTKTQQIQTTPQSATQPSNCLDLYKEGKRFSGGYIIYPEPDKQPLLVYCDMDTDGGGWTVFQRRQDGSEDFYRGWDDYASGFGDVANEFWLGNDHISKLTNTCCNELRVDLVDEDGKTTFAKYSSFRVFPSASNYKLEISGFSGDAGDALSYHSGRQFSTKDRDNDLSGSNCAVICSSAWWYKDCYHSNLNGMYKGNRSTKSVRWLDSLPKYSIMKWSEMKFRLKS